MVAYEPWWNRLALSDLSDDQWEALCDGCGKCCLHKLQDEDTEELLFTAVACKLLDCQSCRCTNYSNRLSLVPDCINIRSHDLEELSYMPSTCAYRLRYEGKVLPDWHPLVSGDSKTVHDQHMSVRGRVISETKVSEDDWESYIISDL